MESKKKIADDLKALLPDDTDLLGTDGMAIRAEIVQKRAEHEHDKKTASELARARYNIRIGREQQIANEAIRNRQAAQEFAEAEVLEQLENENDQMTPQQAIEIANTEAVKANQPTISMASDTARALINAQGTTRPEVARLLTQLNINMNLQLTKTDTANLLACLLTANEAQLAAIYSNKKVPLAIKTVIRRIMDDAKLGNIDTIERLWDRIFGKTGMMQLDLPQQVQMSTGIIPGTPISREAYIILRDTLIK